jgi:hypothetical protein
LVGGSWSRRTKILAYPSTVPASHGKERVMILFKYPVHETINDVTLTYTGPDQDPVKAERTTEGDLEDYFLWVDVEDTPATHVVMDVNTGEQKIKILARQSKEVWWKYKIFLNTNPLTFQRRHKGGDWEPEQPAPVTALRIKLSSENASHPVDSMSISNDNARIEYRGSNCSLTWNPATRRYSLRCR